MPSTRTARTRSTSSSTAGPSSKSKARSSTPARATSSRWTEAGTTTSSTSARTWPSWSSLPRPTTQKAETGAVKIIETAEAPHHTGPVPQAVESGGWIFVSALFGNDPQTGRRSPEVGGGEATDLVITDAPPAAAAPPGRQQSVGPPVRRPSALPIGGRGEGFRPARRGRPLHGGGSGVPRLTV